MTSKELIENVSTDPNYFTIMEADCSSVNIVCNTNPELNLYIISKDNLFPYMVSLASKVNNDLNKAVLFEVK